MIKSVTHFYRKKTVATKAKYTVSHNEMCEKELLSDLKGTYKSAKYLLPLLSTCGFLMYAN